MVKFFECVNSFVCKVCLSTQSSRHSLFCGERYVQKNQLFRQKQDYDLSLKFFAVVRQKQINISCADL